MIYTINVTQDHIEKSRRPDWSYLWYRVNHARLHKKWNIMRMLEAKLITTELYLELMDKNEQMEPKVLAYYQAKVRPIGWWTTKVKIPATLDKKKRLIPEHWGMVTKVKNQETGKWEFPKTLELFIDSCPIEMAINETVEASAVQVHWEGKHLMVWPIDSMAPNLVPITFSKALDFIKRHRTGKTVKPFTWELEL